MQAKIYPIVECENGRLSILARPRGGDWLEEEVTSWRKQRIDVVVSLLERTEVEDLNLELEEAICTRTGIEFISFPIADRGVPNSHEKTIELANELLTKLFEGKSIGFHCRMGIGRSGLIVACVLVASGVTPEIAWQTIEKARGCSVPDTDEQRLWVGEE